MSNLGAYPGSNQDYGYPMVELDSDEEFGKCDSSEDDLEVILHGTPEQKRRLRRISLGKESSSSDDDFEKEMGEELSSTMDRLRKAATTGITEQKSITAPSGTESKCYDNAYFDSDSDEEGSSKEKKKAHHPVLDNDELLYDPDMDRQDELWVQKQRGTYRNKGDAAAKQKATAGGKKSSSRMPQSDAVLNCPACMTLLCLDCQRHELYKHQYRAMFVKNCNVITTERLRYPAATGKKRKKTKRPAQSPLEDLETIDEGSTAPKTAQGIDIDTAGPSTDTSDELFHPVKCTVCESEVGVCDSDEVFHFFNVLASYT